jgi:hypothetical protein
LSQAGPGLLVLKLPGYAKPGDTLSLTFDSAVEALRQVDVATYLDDPNRPLTLHGLLQPLPDGRITNSSDQKLAQ